MSSLKPYYLYYNDIDNHWKVLNRRGGVFGDSETIDGAINSALCLGIAEDDIEV